jgi:hypothetical protein
VPGRLVLDEATRFREEDPFTDRIAACADAHVVVHRSRFEVDLNRARSSAVYGGPEEAWGLELWDGPLPDSVVQGSLAVYDAFYETLAQQLDALTADGPFVVFDVHSYNHRRDGHDGPEAPASENPDVNVGTGSLDRVRWAPVVDALLDSLHGVDVGGAPLDARENVRFRGAHLAQWVHTRYPDTGCALALEFKKTFMDEWTGEVDHNRLDALTEALGASIPVVLDALGRVSG